MLNHAGNKIANSILNGGGKGGKKGNNTTNSDDAGYDPNPNRNLKDDRPLDKKEIKKLKEKGWDHKDKGRNGGGKKDLWVDKEGNIYEKPKSGAGQGEWKTLTYQ